ncbi:autotransporter outer membrane beta-barrel domain-containing protein [Methanobrevibacter curvatus]|uniref:Uncharacterized protein n=1 Tax=Methanobrevibacter curvatus TaxID=49547 RepID=A0A166ARC1_9EURY|nr:CARDB domain-containing protein [Methanobrevibacter curvatus]KZX12376.1 hypothetical protein MBCUR_10680 [Methanobrevibacter curvatus]
MINKEGTGKKNSLLFLIILISVFLAIGMIGSVSAANQTITNTTDGGLKTAIDTVGDSETIFLEDGVYFGENNTGIAINKNLTIQGKGNNVLFDGKKQDSIFTINSNVKVELNNIYFKNGASNFGGAIVAGDNSTVTVTNCVFANNSASTDGGAIFFTNGNLTIKNSQFIANTASGAGGAIGIMATGTLKVYNTKFLGNKGKNGGAIGSLFANITITDSYFRGNSYEEIYNTYGNLVMTNTDISSSTNFYVSEYTTVNEINSWIVKAKTGGNLIFETPSYKLTDTINIKKALNIKSTNNTIINFYKNKADIFNASVSGVKFQSLTINFYGNGTSSIGYAAINSNAKSLTNISISNVKINLYGNYIIGVNIDNWKGNIVKSIIKTSNNKVNVGISSNKWIGSISDSSIIIKGSYSNGGIYSKDWVGNILNSNISVSGDINTVAVLSSKWNGKVQNSKITATGKAPAAFAALDSKGTISKSTITAKSGCPVMVSDQVTVKSSKLTAKKGYLKIFRYRPDLILYKNAITRSGNSYKFKVYNDGYLPSKATYLRIKYNGKYKNYKIKALNPKKSLSFKVTIPSKYANKKYTKYLILDSPKKVKELDEGNTWYFKF